MVQYFSKVKDYLFELGFEIQTENPAEGLVVITDEEKGISNLVIDCEDEILVLEQFILPLKSADPQILKRLLQINRETVHGALVLDETGSKVIFRDTLQLKNLDLNELEASVNAISLMLAEHAEEFIKFSK
jgi:hypothetical protein